MKRRPPRRSPPRSIPRSSARKTVRARARELRTAAQRRRHDEPGAAEAAEGGVAARTPRDPPRARRAPHPTVQPPAATVQAPTPTVSPAAHRSLARGDRPIARRAMARHESLALRAIERRRPLVGPTIRHRLSPSPRRRFRGRPARRPEPRAEPAGAGAEEAAAAAPDPLLRTPQVFRRLDRGRPRRTPPRAGTLSSQLMETEKRPPRALRRNVAAGARAPRSRGTAPLRPKRRRPGRSKPRPPGLGRASPRGRRSRRRAARPPRVSPARASAVPPDGAASRCPTCPASRTS
jgi:hypothetical protein